MTIKIETVPVPDIMPTATSYDFSDLVNKVVEGRPLYVMYKRFGKHIVAIILQSETCRYKADVSYPYCPYELKKATNVSFIDTDIPHVYRFTLNKNQKMD